MSSESAWLATSGCLPCPLQIPPHARELYGTPLPSFPHPDRAYWSVPLSSWYLPLHFKAQFDEGLIVLELPAHQFTRLLAMLAHEGMHTRDSLTKLQIRLRASACHRLVAQLWRDSGNTDLWVEIHRYNVAIAGLTRSISLVEELTSTIFGIEYLRSCAELRTSPEQQIDEIEDEFVENQIRRFGPRFRDLYSQLSALHYSFGTFPIELLTTYVQDSVRLISPMIIGSDKYEIETRLSKALDFVSSLHYSRNDLKSLSEADWCTIFVANHTSLPGFAEWCDEGGAGDLLMKESGEALQRQAEWWPQDVNPVIASMLLADGGGGFGFLTLPPESDPLKLKWTPEGEAVGAKVTAMFLEARRRGHTLVLLESLPNRLEMGFVQVPTQHSLITPGPGKGVLISFGKPELEKALTGLMALVLLESFRVLVESAIPSWGGHLPRIDWTVRLRTTLNLWPLTSAAIKLAESMD